MKFKKNKIVFISVLAVILIFIIAYSYWHFKSPKENRKKIQRTELPKIDLKDFKEYDSRMEAVEDIEESRDQTIPSVYNENLLDSLGYYDPAQEQKEKEQLLDSIFNSPSIHLGKTAHKANKLESTQIKTIPKEQQSPSTLNEFIEPIRTAHEAFFQSPPVSDIPANLISSPIPAIVDGDQVIRNNSRLRLRLLEDININSKIIPKNTLVYGIATLQSNRILLKIENIGPDPVSISVLDAEDYRDGIYLENNLRSEVQNEIGETTLGTINIPGTPAIGRIGNLFRRNLHREKATVLNQYKVLLIQH